MQRRTCTCTNSFRSSPVWLVFTFILLLCFVSLTSPIFGADPARDVDPSNVVSSVDRAGPDEIFGANTPLGRLSYQAGRGLRVGDTGLVIGGFATSEIERMEGGRSNGGIDAVNFLAFIDPTPYLQLFTELEVGQLAMLESDHKGVHADPKIEIKRLYLDFGTSDLLKVRFGKFLTPIGRWNTIRIEPLLWTTSDPLIVEEAFDKTATGAMLHGSVFPSGGALSYSLYGGFLDPLNVPPDERPAKHNAGAHLEWASLKGWTLGASYFASEPHRGHWNHIGGVDALWQPNQRVEITGEALFGEGNREDGTLWGLYAQAVVETVRTLYLVGRYERFAPPSAEHDVNLFDIGIAWVPAPYLRLKADYLIADRHNERAEPGLHMSFSILF